MTEDAGSPPLVLVDETLRDGLQSTAVVGPSLDEKLLLLHQMRAVGAQVVSVGFPAGGRQAEREAIALTRELAAARLRMQPTAAARTTTTDVEAVARVADAVGAPLEVYAFIGSSPIRHAAEAWDETFLKRQVRTSARRARALGLAFCLVTEDTTRSPPVILRTLFDCALDEGASRLCLCDTVGHATPHGTRTLVRWVQRYLDERGHPVALDWHAHNDRGLALATALAAADSGVQRIHGTALGIGERVGNPPLELLVTHLYERLDPDSRPAEPLAALRRYCAFAAASLGLDPPGPPHPLFSDGGPASRR